MDRGVVVTEETTNNIQLLQRDALISLVNRTLLLFLLVIILLLFFAGRLSFRLRRLSSEAASAVDEHGRVKGVMSVSEDSDEIGDLSRSYAAMLQRLKHYNNYLEGMAGRLSHELRTPMALVQSSLDNLDLDDGSNKERFIARAREGIERLNLLVTRLSEATRIEQALQDAERVSIDLCQLLSRTIEGYRQIFISQEFVLKLPEASVEMAVTPDLFIQMLDKLIANAVDFSNPDKPVIIELSRESDRYILSVTNSGPPLPSTMQTKLFDSMISMRDEQNQDKPHLGLGLYIARLIAEFHHGTITAENLKAEHGVRFSIIFEAGDR